MRNFIALTVIGMVALADAKLVQKSLGQAFAPNEKALENSRHAFGLENFSLPAHANGKAHDKWFGGEKGGDSEPSETSELTDEEEEEVDLTEETEEETPEETEEETPEETEEETPEETEEETPEETVEEETPEETVEEETPEETVEEETPETLA